MQAAEFAALSRQKASFVSVTGGWHETRVPQIIAAVPPAAYAYLARGVRERVKIPVFAANRINHPQIGERLLADGMADAVCFGRALIADPDLPRKASEGRQDRVVRCVGCAQGCFDKVMSLEAVTCMVNPVVGREGEAPPPAPARRKKVLVVGGGPAGLMAAAVAAERGHEVILSERVNLGGQLALAASSPGRRELGLIADDLVVRARNAGVDLRVGDSLDADAILSYGADAVVFATGGRPLRPRIPGVDGANVQQAWDVLAGRAVPGRDVVVVGGGAVGVDVARHIALLGALDADTIRFLLVEEAESPEEIRRLARRGTRNVTLVEMRRKIGADIGVSTRWSLMQDLERYGVTLITGRKVTRITPEGLELEGDGVPLLTCDTIVLAAGAESERTLYDAVASRLPEAHLLGDAKDVRRAFDAVADGYAVGSAIWTATREAEPGGRLARPRKQLLRRERATDAAGSGGDGARSPCRAARGPIRPGVRLGSASRTRTGAGPDLALGFAGSLADGPRATVGGARVVAGMPVDPSMWPVRARCCAGRSRERVA